MAIGVTTTLAMSIEQFDALHAAMLRHPMPPEVGLLSHVSRATAAGVEVIEVWDSQEAFERFMREIAPAVLNEVLGDGGFAPEIRTEFWQVRGLVIPGAGLTI